MTQPLRIGVMLDGTGLKRWELQCLGDLAARDHVTIALAVSNPVRARRSRAWQRLRKLPRRAHELPWMAVDELDRRFARRDASASAMDDLDLGELARDIPVLEAEPQADPHGPGQRLRDGDVARIQAYELDVLLRFGFNILKGPILSAARHGVWSFHHADNRVNRGMPPGFWEIAEGAEVTGVTLQRLTEDLDNGEVLARGWYPTDRTSWNRSHQRIADRGRDLLTDAIDHLARHGRPPRADEPPINVYCHRLYRKPGPATALATAARVYTRPFARKLAAAVRHDQWHVRWGHADAANASIHRLHRLTPPPDRLWADPFPAVHDGRVWLFVEELLFAEDRGRIVALQVEGDRVRDHRVVMEPSHHLSYPYLFERDGTLYMIPESNENRTVDLWRCTGFPDRWERVHALLPDVRAADTSLLEHEGRAYLFTTLSRREGLDRSTELHLFHADDPLSGDWQPHAANPVLVDCRNARMAGGFFTGNDGSVIRCAQYHGAQYGQAIQLRRITRLTPDAYAEAPAGTVVPRWQQGLTGTHHISARDGIVCVDACATLPRWRMRRPRDSALDSASAPATQKARAQATSTEPSAARHAPGALARGTGEGQLEPRRMNREA